MLLKKEIQETCFRNNLAKLKLHIYIRIKISKTKKIEIFRPLFRECMSEINIKAYIYTHIKKKSLKAF